MKKYLVPINFVLLCVYLTYAIFPLAYDTISDDPGAPYRLRGAPAKTIKLYLTDAILSAFARTDQDHDDRNTSSQDHILLIKSSVLRASQVRLIAQCSVRPAKHSVDPPLRKSSIKVLPTTARLTCPHGYEFLHSGSSPPSA